MESASEPQYLRYDDFISRIAKEVDQGFGFVPLVGSGLSAASGILIGQQFLDYFTFVLYSCFEKSWDLSRYGWPDIPPLDQIAEASAWRTSAQRMAFIQQVVPSDCAYDLSLLQEGMGSLANWRTSLYFLSRLRREENRLKAYDPDYNTIDQFNDHITRNKLPNHGHRLLAHIARPLRIQTILTTNFDTLIESAFQERQTPLTSYDIPLAGYLPSYRIVRSQNAIIKLHGSKISTRSDYSLDGEPTANDLDNFMRYLIESSVTSSSRREEPILSTANHLLVVGYSGSDRRVTLLIKKTFEKLKERRKKRREDSPKVFWIAHTWSGYRTVQRLFAGMENVFVTIASADIILYELYQRITGTLPARGLHYPISHIVAPFESEQLDSHAIKKESGFILGHIQRDGPRSLLVLRRAKDRKTAEPARGLSSIGAQVYWCLRGQHPTVESSAPVDRFCLWHELDDFGSPAEIVPTTLQYLADLVGFQERHLLIYKTSAKGLASALRQMRIEPAKCFVFIYAGNEPGIHSGWLEPGHKWEAEKESPILKEQLDILLGAGLKVIFMEGCDRAEQYQWDTPNVIEVADVRSGGVDTSTQITAGEALGILADALLSLPTEARRPAAALWLFHSLLYRQSRYFFQVCFRHEFLGPATDPNCPFYSMRHSTEVLEKYVKIGLFRKKAGGGYWMHTDTKSRLLRELESGEFQALITRHRAALHFAIAETYLVCFRAARSATPLCEAIFHLANCARLADAALQTSTRGSDTPPPELSFPDSVIDLAVHDASLKEVVENHGRLLISAGWSSATRMLVYSLALLNHYLRVGRNLILDSVDPSCHLHWFQPAVVPRFDHRQEPGIAPKLIAKYESSLKEIVTEIGSKLAAGLQSPTTTEKSPHAPRDVSYTVPGDVGVIDRLRRQAKDAVTRLDYDGAESSLAQSLQHALGILGSSSSADSAEEMIVVSSKCLRDYTYLQHLKVRLKIVFDWAAAKDGMSGVLERWNGLAKEWNRVYWLARLSYETTRILPFPKAAHRSRERFILLSICALAEAYARRFSAGHEDLNEAFGFLSRSEFAKHEHEWGILELRRAELYIVESEFGVMELMSDIEAEVGARLPKAKDWMFRERGLAVVTPQPALIDSVLANLDSAWSALLRAAFKLNGKISFWWWRTHALLKMRVLALLTNLDCVCQLTAPATPPPESKESGASTYFIRVRGFADREGGGRLRAVRDILRESLLLWPAEPYDMFRLVQYACIVVWGDIHRDPRAAKPRISSDQLTAGPVDFFQDRREELYREIVTACVKCLCEAASHYRNTLNERVIAKVDLLREEGPLADFCTHVTENWLKRLIGSDAVFPAGGKNDAGYFEVKEQLRRHLAEEVVPLFARPKPRV